MEKTPLKNPRGREYPPVSAFFARFQSRACIFPFLHSLPIRLLAKRLATLGIGRGASPPQPSPPFRMEGRALISWAGNPGRPSRCSVALGYYRSPLPGLKTALKNARFHLILSINRTSKLHSFCLLHSPFFPCPLHPPNIPCRHAQSGTPGASRNRLSGKGPRKNGGRSFATGEVARLGWIPGSRTITVALKRGNNMTISRTHICNFPG